MPCCGQGGGNLLNKAAIGAENRSSAGCGSGPDLPRNRDEGENHGLFADPDFVTTQIDQLARFMPPESFKILHDQAEDIASTNTAALASGP